MHSQLQLKKTEALLITSKPNIYYFSDIYIEGGVFLLLAQNKKFVFTDARFIKGAAKIAKNFIPIAIDKKDALWWRGVLQKNNIKTIYFDPYSLTSYEWNKFRKLSRGFAQLKPARIDLRALRGIKTTQELGFIKKAAIIASTVLKEIASFLHNPSKPPTEYDVVVEIHKCALAYGCIELSFSPIVAFGTNSGIPHHQPSSGRRLKKGDMVLIDMGVKYRGYCSDITRTFFTAPPTARQEEIYNKVLHAQKKTIEIIKAGISAKKLYETAYKTLGKDAPHFTHGLGHGVGLEIHEHPSLKPKSPDVLRAGQVITVEPGLYFNWGGVRIEDMVAVGRKNCNLITKVAKTVKHILITS